MDINQKEKMYQEVEQAAMKKYIESKDLKNAVSGALLDACKNLSQRDIVDFADWLDFTHGNSINVAHSKGLGKLAEVDYEMLNQCKSIEKEIKAANPVKMPKKFKKQNKRVERLTKKTEKLLEL